MRENILIFLLLLAAVFACYGAVLDAGFVWDDQYLVSGNALLRAPLWSFQVFKQDIVNSNFTYTIYYRPIQILSYCVDYRLGGMDPFVFHLSSILLHFINGILVFLFAQKLTQEKVISAITAVLFVVHPAQAGAVSYVSSRADLLFFLFGFLSMLFYVLYREKNCGTFLAAGVLSLILSLLSKEAAVIFPFLLLFTDGVMLRKRLNFRFVYHIPYLFTAGVYIAFHRLFFGGRYSAMFDPAQLGKSFLEYLRMAGEFFVLGIFPFGLHIRKGAGETVMPQAVF
ncbi:MAG: hypothetical protein PVH45_01500, partial [Candidatus Omnitrophota bacterium]